MTLSMPGLIGAAAGLVFALGIYIAMSTAWRRNLNDASAPAEQRERFERMWPTVRLILIADFVLLGALGYFAGETLGS